ncbi:MAG: Rrf2 family transcriptional regulator [Gammaproteobacteria bacterium]
MTISSRAHYAIKAMLNLAFQMPNPVSLTSLAKKLDISLSYLEQIFALLRKNNLVKGVRGPGGGYVLGKPTEVITIADIVSAIDVNRKTAADFNGQPQSATLMAWGLLENKVPAAPKTRRRRVFYSFAVPDVCDCQASISINTRLTTGISALI